jgi:hypothetical protein
MLFILFIVSFLFMLSIVRYVAALFFPMPIEIEASPNLQNWAGINHAEPKRQQAMQNSMAPLQYYFISSFVSGSAMAPNTLCTRIED